MVNETVKRIVSLSTGGYHQIVTNIMEGRRHKISDWGCYSRILDHLQAKCKKTLNIPLVRFHIILFRGLQIDIAQFYNSGPGCSKHR